jgi:hypothetical protein
VISYKSALAAFEKQYRNCALGAGLIQALGANCSSTYRSVSWLVYKAIFFLAIKDLVDSGEPYCSNVCHLRDFHFKLESVLSLQGKKVSLGEVVASMLPLSNIESLFASIDTILGQSLRHALETNELTCPCCGGTFKLVEEKPTVFKDIYEVYTSRNIHCHELAPNQAVLIRDAERYVHSIALFLWR